MLHQYLEIQETLPDKQVEAGTDPQEVRIEVDNKEEAMKLYPVYEDDFKGLNYTVQYHIHKHSAIGKNESCVIEVIK